MTTCSRCRYLNRLLGWNPDRVLLGRILQLLLTHNCHTPADPNEGIDETRLDHAAEAERDLREYGDEL